MPVEKNPDMNTDEAGTNWPDGHDDSQRPPLPTSAAPPPISRIALTVGGQTERPHAFLVQAVHSELLGPEHCVQDEWHGWQIRSSPDQKPLGHLVRHWPLVERYAFAPTESHVRQCELVGPLHAPPQVEWHGWQMPAGSGEKL